MQKLNQYSTIRGEPKHKRGAGDTMDTLYDTLLKPHTILLTILGYIAILVKDNPFRHIPGALDGNEISILHLLLILLSVIAGLRIIQCLYLAKRDYGHLRNGFLDVLIFGLVIVFTGGTVVMGLDGHLLIVLLVYLLCAFGGALNFFLLYRYRIPRNSEKYDYPIERQIQLVNTWTFVYLTTALAYASYSLIQAGTPTTSCLVAIAITYVPLILNIVHSEQLSLMPKFLLKNDPDSPPYQIKLFRQIFRRTADDLTDEEIKKLIHKDVSNKFQSIKTVRAKASDVSALAKEILKEFGYIYKYIFGTSDQALLHRALVKLLSVAGGLGSFGYMHFYLLKSGPTVVGFVRLDTSDKCVFYLWIEILILPFELAKLFGISRLWAILCRSHEVVRTQPEVGQEEIRLTYIFIYSEHQRKGFGGAALRLLINALIYNVTDEIVSDRISLFVRERNKIAEQFFAKAGFRYVNRDDTASVDPVSEIEAIGPLIGMEYAEAVQID